MGDMATVEIDLELLREFERGLDPRHPERSKVPARILGYGEISTVFEIQAGPMCGLACKRLPIFRTAEEMARYQATYEEYNRLLQQVGLALPPHGHAAFSDDAGRPVFYIIQQELPHASLGHRAIHLLPRDQALAFARRVFEELSKVWRFNRSQSRLQIGLDGQASNWSLADFDPQHPTCGPATPLVYIDTSTPLFRRDGVEQLDPELFLRSAPSFLSWLLRLFFLKDVVDRYYDLHRVAVDLIANMYKEQRPDLIPDLIATANEYFAGQPELAVAPITAQEVHTYYRQDATIWRLYLAMRKVDRTLHTRLLRRRYPYILPERVRR
jgi:hypothetical protein